MSRTSLHSILGIWGGIYGRGSDMLHGPKRGNKFLIGER